MSIKGITLKESMNRSVQAIMPLDEEKEVRIESQITSD